MVMMMSRTATQRSEVMFAIAACSDVLHGVKAFIIEHERLLARVPVVVVLVVGPIIRTLAERLDRFRGTLLQLILAEIFVSGRSGPLAYVSLGRQLGLAPHGAGRDAV